MNRNTEPLLTVFTSFRRNLLSIIRYFLHSEEDAEDTLQEAFCRLWQHRAKIQSEQDARRVAVTTVRHLCIDTLRKQLPETVYEFDDERDAPLTQSTDEVMEWQEKFHIVEQIINSRLTFMQREVLYRKEFKGESVEKVASDLHLQPASVRMHLSRARKVIRECYKQIAYE